MLTFQDFQKNCTTKSNTATFIGRLISEHIASDAYRTAIDADAYDCQRNTTINRFSKAIYSNDGRRVIDPTASNNRIASNFFHRLNTQRCTYSLGNGVTFNGENTKAALGDTFDTELSHAGYYALIHGLSFVFWNVDHIHVFPMTQCVPLWDEETGALRACVRFWRIDPHKPAQAVLYEEDGYTRFRSETGLSSFVESEQKRAYRISIQKAAVDAEPEVVGAENYSALPVVPLWGNRNHQSTLVGMKAAIDSYDLIQSGFANDLTDCAEVYWIISNADGMDSDDLARFRNRLKLTHVAQADEGDVKPYAQDLPTTARKLFLDSIRDSIYESYGGLDVHSVSAASTNDHLEAAYQPMDENADDFEYQIIECVQNLLMLQGITDTPVFKRNRISNQAQQTNMILLCKDYLDDETVLTKLPFISPDEVKTIMERRDLQDYEQFNEELDQQRQIEDSKPVEKPVENGDDA